jgi:hypothetical protein
LFLVVIMLRRIIYETTKNSFVELNNHRGRLSTVFMLKTFVLSHSFPTVIFGERAAIVQETFVFAREPGPRPAPFQFL